jgi:hypothetical protein
MSRIKPPFQTASVFKLLVNVESLPYAGTNVARKLRQSGSVEPEKYDNQQAKESLHMLWTILVILLVLWLLGLIGGVGGSLIHLLLVVALVIFVINLLTGRRTV